MYFFFSIIIFTNINIIINKNSNIMLNTFGYIAIHSENRFIIVIKIVENKELINPVNIIECCSIYFSPLYKMFQSPHFIKVDYI